MKTVRIGGFDSGQTFAFKLDVEGKRISDYLNRSAKKINKACDGIIFTQINERYYVIICELKSGKPDVQECVIKYRNSTLFIKLIINILEEFFGSAQKFGFRYILFDIKRNALKTPTKRKKIAPGKFVDKEDGKEISVYRVHRLRPGERINIRHLKL